MTVEVRLFAGLRRYLPRDSGRTSARLHLASGATIRDVLAGLGIPPEAVHMALVDGAQESNLERALRGDCTLSVFPSLAGG